MQNCRENHEVDFPKNVCLILIVQNSCSMLNIEVAMPFPFAAITFRPEIITHIHRMLIGKISQKA
jgi:hypothetical protein